MKTQLLNSDEIRSLLPAILKEWNHQPYCLALAKTVKALREKNRQPEIVFACTADIADRWLDSHLYLDHCATASFEDKQIAVRAMLNDVIKKSR